MVAGLRPYDNDEAYTVIVLGDQISPGLATVSGHDRFEDWDVKQAKGATGASSSLKGRPVGQFQVSFYLADDRIDGEETEFDRWEVFQDLVESMTEGATPIALPIYHPDLARNGFTEVASGGVGAPIHDGRGGVTIIVKFIEYRPPKPKKVKRAKAKASSGRRVGVTTVHAPDPNAAAKAELDALVEQASQP